jgi:hypothetical protein
LATALDAPDKDAGLPVLGQAVDVQATVDGQGGDAGPGKVGPGLGLGVFGGGLAVFRDVEVEAEIGGGEDGEGKGGNTRDQPAVLVVKVKTPPQLETCR